MVKQKPKMLNNKNCFYCKQPIGELEDYCVLVSHSHGVISNQDKWHRHCFVEWLDKRIETKLNALINQGIGKVADVMKNRGISA